MYLQSPVSPVPVRYDCDKEEDGDEGKKNKENNIIRFAIYGKYSTLYTILRHTVCTLYSLVFVP